MGVEHMMIGPATALSPWPLTLLGWVWVARETALAIDSTARLVRQARRRRASRVTLRIGRPPGGV